MKKAAGDSFKYARRVLSTVRLFKANGASEEELLAAIAEFFDDFRKTRTSKILEEEDDVDDVGNDDIDIIPP